MSNIQKSIKLSRCKNKNIVIKNIYAPGFYRLEKNQTLHIHPLDLKYKSRVKCSRVYEYEGYDEGYSMDWNIPSHSNKLLTFENPENRAIIVMVNQKERGKFMRKLKNLFHSKTKDESSCDHKHIEYL